MNGYAYSRITVQVDQKAEKEDRNSEMQKFISSTLREQTMYPL